MRQICRVTTFSQSLWVMHAAKFWRLLSTDLVEDLKIVVKANFKSKIARQKSRPGGARTCG